MGRVCGVAMVECHQKGVCGVLYHRWWWPGPAESSGGSFGGARQLPSRLKEKPAGIC